MKAGKDAVKKHDEKLADEELADDESRSYAYKKLANVLVEKEWTTGFQDPEHKPKPVKPIAHGSAAIAKAEEGIPQRVKDAAKKKVAAEEAARLKKQQNSHTEYKRMGLYLAEAMGYRVDEALPLVLAKLGAGAAKVGKTLASKFAKKKAVGMAKKKLAGRVQAGPEGVATGDDTAQKGAELGQQAASDDDLKEDSRRGGRYGSSPHGGRPVGGWTPPTPLPKKKKKKAPKPEAPKPEAPKPEAPKPEPNPPEESQTTEGKIMNKYIKALMEKAGRDLSPVQKRYEKVSASDVAAAKPGRGGVDPQVQKDVGDEAARTQAKIPGANPSAGHLLAQKKARDAAAKAKGEKPTGDTRGKGVYGSEPSRT